MCAECGASGVVVVVAANGCLWLKREREKWAVAEVSAAFRSPPEGKPAQVRRISGRKHFARRALTHTLTDLFVGSRREVGGKQGLFLSRLGWGQVSYTLCRSHCAGAGETGRPSQPAKLLFTDVLAAPSAAWRLVERRRTSHHHIGTLTRILVRLP